MAIVIVAQTEGAEFKVAPIAFDTIALLRLDVTCFASRTVPLLRAPECIVEACIVYVTTCCTRVCVLVAAIADTLVNESL